MIQRIFLLSLCFFAALSAAEDVGIVIAKGQVLAGPKDNLKAVKIGSRIEDGQTVKTGADGLVILRYTDDSKVKLKENSEVVIHAIPAKAPQGLEIVIGAVFASVSKHPNQKFEVKTPTGVAGVRGTQFFTAYDKQTWMCVEEGQVEISESKLAKSTLVNAGFGVLVEAGKEIAPPKKYAWTKKLNWNMDPESGDVTDKTKIDSEYKMLKRDYD